MCLFATVRRLLVENTNSCEFCSSAVERRSWGKAAVARQFERARRHSKDRHNIRTPADSCTCSVSGAVAFSLQRPAAPSPQQRLLAAGFKSLFGWRGNEACSRQPQVLPLSLCLLRLLLLEPRAHLRLSPSLSAASLRCLSSSRETPARARGKQALTLHTLPWQGSVGPSVQK